MDSTEVVSKPESSFGFRHVMVFLLFLSTTVAYATRVSISVAIVAMTDVGGNSSYPVYDWSQSIKDTILSSFFWGYIVLQIPAGMLAGRFGGRWLMLVSLFSNGIINIFIPMAAYQGGWKAIVACRVMLGLTQGVLYPSVHGILGSWAPANERSRMGTIVYAGSLLGTIIEMVLAGFLSASSWGWPSVYYVAAATCLVWSVLWFFFGASSPAESRWISKEERKYIETSGGSCDLSAHKNLPTPWRKIWTSLPFWSILIAHSGQSLGFWTLLTEMPSYMSKVLGVDIKTNGLLSALPYVAMYTLSFFFSWAADFITNRNLLSLTTTRKLFNSIAFWGPAAALLALAYMPAGNLTLAVIILTITVGLNGAHYVGFLISHIDIASNYSSTLMGITNGVGNIFSIMAPLSVSLVIEDDTNATEWRKVFFISVAFYFLGNLFFILFASGNEQEWNRPTLSNNIENGAKENYAPEQKKQSHKEEARF